MKMNENLAQIRPKEKGLICWKIKNSRQQHNIILYYWITSKQAFLSLNLESGMIITQVMFI